MAHILGISNVAAGLSPEEKLQRIHAARASAGQSNQKRSGVIMVRAGLLPAMRLGVSGAQGEGCMCCMWYARMGLRAAARPVTAGPLACGADLP